jgi:hypothetical protein
MKLEAKNRFRSAAMLRSPVLETEAHKGNVTQVIPTSMKIWVAYFLSYQRGQTNTRTDGYSQGHDVVMSLDFLIMLEKETKYEA